MSTRRAGLVSFVGGLLLLGAGVAYADPDQDVTLRLDEWLIEPASVSVRAGEKVRFVANNTGQRPHDVHIEGQGVMMQVVPGGDNHVAAGQTATFEFTFDRPGTYQMWCPVGNHREQGMQGTFMVTAAGGAAPARAGGPTAAVVAGGLATLGAGLIGASVVVRRRRQT